MKAKWLIAIALFSDAMTVQIYNDQCALQATYYADQVWVHSDEATMDIQESNGEKLHLNFKFGIKEAQLSYQKFFQSYQYENGKINFKDQPYCRGSI